MYMVISCNLVVFVVLSQLQLEVTSLMLAQTSYWSFSVHFTTFKIAPQTAQDLHLQVCLSGYYERISFITGKDTIDLLKE